MAVITNVKVLLSALSAKVVGVTLPFLGRRFRASASVTTFAVANCALTLTVSVLPLNMLDSGFKGLGVSCLKFILFNLDSLFYNLVGGVDLLVVKQVFRNVKTTTLRTASTTLVAALISRGHGGDSVNVLKVVVNLNPVLKPSLNKVVLSLDF